MKKIFILLTLVGGTGANAFAMGNDAIRDSDRFLSQPQNIIVMENDITKNTNNFVLKPKQEFRSNRTL